MSTEPDLSSLGHKVGPLPAGVWILAIGGGLVLAYVMRTRSAATPATSDDSGDSSGLPNGVGQEDTDTGTDTTTATPGTNEDWQRQADIILIGMGYESVSVDRALADYLAGNALTTVERAIVDEAILQMGPPPQSPPPPATADQPPPTVTPVTPTAPKLPPWAATGVARLESPTPAPLPKWATTGLARLEPTT